MTTSAWRNTLGTVLLVTAPAAVLASCTATLEPAADALPAAGGGATASAGGVQIVTMTPDFPGVVDIENAVTPVKVDITNHGSSTVLIRYSDFKLVGADGTVYPALPLRKIDATATAPVPGYDRISSPLFLHRGFRVAPYYGGIYPGIAPFGGPFRYGYGRYGWDDYDAAFSGITTVKLPTPTMSRNVLPEGVLDPGGSLQGWLYFKHVGNQKGDISFDASLVSVTGANLGSLTIPYTFAK
ncbi:hypothetical protein [Sphingomonas sp. M1-B02]|uniref:hypothetical protein n=1 Tax=Sphingomonas sp. M1-B02 TaxID=3114300 RepID=UPI0022408FF8|nr:hypothetical protein [Sphingomonas sp. S6-11]UZK66295.1 hypothetical protein OKW87_00180 [Sphingomonas sp. S6-11]